MRNTHASIVLGPIVCPVFL